MLVIKKDGKEKSFDILKIRTAVEKANKETNELDAAELDKVSNYVLNECNKIKRSIHVEEIQEIVENALMKYNHFETAKAYIKYRYQKQLNKKQNTIDGQVLSTVNLENEEVKQENSNKNPTIIPTQRDYIAGIVSKDLTNRYLLPRDVVEAHNKGLIHFHDADYFIQKSHNCDLVNLEDMLQNGTVINGVEIEKPHSFLTACTIMTQIMAIVASCQYGGQTMSLAHIAPFVDISRQRLKKEVEKESLDNDLKLTEEQIKNIVNSRLKKEIKKGVETIQYQILTLNSTNGQTPFVSLNMYLNEAKNKQEKEDLALIIEEVLKQRIQGIKNEKGVWITPAFPKLLYVLEKDNIEEGQPYYYLTELAAKCTAKRMVPDYVSEKIMLELKGDCYPPMGCRSFLTPDRFTDTGVGNVANAKDYEPGKHKYYGRLNCGVVTINLPYVALESKKNLDKFWKNLDETCELAHKALKLRHEHLRQTPSDVAPLLWQYGALARLQKGETIDKLLYNGYATISLGYGGLWECVYGLIGKELTSLEGKELGLKIMEFLNKKCEEWKSGWREQRKSLAKLNDDVDFDLEEDT